MKKRLLAGPAIRRVLFLSFLLFSAHFVKAQLSTFPTTIDFTAAKPAYITTPSGTSYNTALTDCSSNTTGGISYSSSSKSWTLTATKCSTIVYTIKQPSTTRAVTVSNNKNGITKTTANTKNTCETDTLNINYDGTGGDIIITFAGASGGSSEAIVALTIYDTDPLPVTFTGFNAHETSNGVALDWNVGVELNINRYEIESSSDAISFAKIGSVNAIGSQSYSYTTPASDNNFYRIKVIENSGAISYSSILNLRTNNSGKQELVIGSNPVINDHIDLQLRSFKNGNYTVAIYDLLGVNVSTTTISHAGGTSFKSIQLPSLLQKGIYILKLTGNNVQVNKTIIVQ